MRLRPIAIRSPSELRATFRFLILTVPSKFELDERLLGDLRRAADMERAHGELRARLADRLRGDDAHRLAHIDRRAAGEIAPVAFAADARLGVAGQHRTDFDFLHAGGDELLDMRLLEQRAVRDQHLVARRIAHVLGRGAAEDAARQRRDDGAGIDDGAHLDAAGRAAILFGDDAVLRHVDQTPGQIARVRRLQARCRRDPCARRASS